MDLIAEFVLAYADEQLANKLQSAKVVDYQILRHRDDFRIFVNEPRTGESILKHLTEVLMELGMSLNAAKTDASEDIIGSSVKQDKIEWLYKIPGDANLQRQLLAIRAHSLKCPNSGSVIRAL